MHKAFRKAIRESEDQVEVEDSDHDVPPRPPAPVFHAKAVSVGRKKSRGRPRKVNPYVAVPEVPGNGKLKPENGKPKAKRRGRPKRKHSSSSEEPPLYILPWLSLPSPPLSPLSSPLLSSLFPMLARPSPLISWFLFFFILPLLPFTGVGKSKKVKLI
jgi:hypothetical protein